MDLEILKLIFSDESTRAFGFLFATFMAQKAQQVRKDALEMRSDFREMKDAVKDLAGKIASLEQTQEKRFQEHDGRIERLENIEKQTKPTGG